MLLGSTEWAETHAAELKRRRSSTSTPTATAAASSASRAAIPCSTSSQASPPTSPIRRPASRSTSARAQPPWSRAASSGASERAKAVGQDRRRSATRTCRSVRSARARTIPAFLQHLGLASLNVGYGGEGESGGVYHSLTTPRSTTRASSIRASPMPVVLAKTTGRLVLRMADADLPVAALSATSPTPWRPISTR